jgi:glycosyltransferase involved in cell wall biosynthesis
MLQAASAPEIALANPDGPSAATFVPEVTVVMPCLNEADTVGTCIRKAQRALEEQGIAGEIILADNGSTDGSPQIAAGLGARVVAVPARGYGNALMGGIAAARGRFIIVGDADDSYDFGELPRFVDKLRQGYALVQGCRLPAGGGTVRPGAMPFLHRWLGNPLFSLLARLMFGAPISDVYCGLRGFTRDLYQRLELRCQGMEFATEMVIKSSLRREAIAEVPVTLHPDGRKAHAPHLRTFRDGWRTLRFFLIYSPGWLFFLPGLLLVLLGLLGYALAMPAVTIQGVTFDAHTLLVSSLALLLGYQAMGFAVIGKTVAVRDGLLPPDSRLDRFLSGVGLEKGLLLGSAAFLVGLALLLVAVQQWRLAEFGRLDYASTMRWVIPGVTLAALGFQTVMTSFLLCILGWRRQ